MFGWLINLAYLSLLLVASPFLVWKRITQGKYRNGWSQKFCGSLPERKASSELVVWFHAVSVGEVLQLRQVLDQFRQAVPRANLLITTTTQTGYAVAVEKFPDATVAYFPLDFTWAVHRALQRVQPDLIVLVELEIWPNFIRTAHSLNIPLAIINGRLSENSFGGYSRIRPLISRLLKCFNLIAVQSDEYRERFIALGAPEQQVVTTGSIKFDGVRTNRDHPQTAELREWLQLQAGEVVLIAGSTQDPEEQMVLSIYQSLLPDFPNLRLVIVPRHPERGDGIAATIRAEGFPLLRRSTRASHSGKALPLIGLLDTVGELGACWGLADVAFVGGSFGNRGGQNMLEPAAYGAAVCFGPNTKNFRQIVDLLLSVNGAQRVHTPQELEHFIRESLTDPASAQEHGARAQAMIQQHQGATERTIQLLQQLLSQHRGTAALSTSAKPPQNPS